MPLLDIKPRLGECKLGFAHGSAEGFKRTHRLLVQPFAARDLRVLAGRQHVLQVVVTRTSACIVICCYI